MPHRPSLSRSVCHHFSPVIYFIAILVSLSCALTAATSFSPPSPTLPLSSSDPPCHPLSPSLSLSLFPCTVPTNTFSLETLHRSTPHDATQFRSPHPPGDFIICFCLCPLSFFSLFFYLSLSSLRCRYAYSFARISGIWTMMPCAGKRKKKCEIERDRDGDGEM